MAIKKIKIGDTEHELQTTIANVDDLQTTLDTINEEIDGSIKGLSVSGKVITYTKNDGTTGTITTQDTNTTYSNFVKSGSSAEAGLVPAPSTTAGTTKYLREDGTWTVPPDTNTTYSNMTAATSSAAGKAGLVPAPAAGKQTSFLRGDGTWVVPTNTTYTFNGAVSTIKDNNLTASRALISDSSGKVAVSAVTSTELGYLDGVTSAIQTQLDGKASSGHTHQYAGSSSAGGAATSANKLATARTVTLTGDVTGSASFDGSADASIATTVARTVGYGTCSTAAATAAKVVTIADTSWVLEIGSIIGVRFTNTNTASSVTLNVNGSGAKNIYYNNAKYTSSSSTYCGYANRTIYYMYDGTYWVWINSGIVDGNTVPSAYCTTAAGTAAKTATCNNYALLAKSFTHILIQYANTSQTALTLNINGKGAKPIYINGSASSSSNYTLPAGTYIVYYDGTNYYFRTDGVLTASITSNAGTATKLKTARGIRVDLGKADAGDAATTTFNGSANVDLGVKGTLPLEYGGTGATTVDGALTNLGLTGITTGGTGAAYTATVPGITSLTKGASFIMVMNTVSTSTAPTLNVNNLGAKTIKRRLNTVGTSLQSGYSNNWLASGVPYRVFYDGTYWVVEGYNRPVAADLYGTLPISKGGTGATTATEALTNLGIETGLTTTTTASNNNTCSWMYHKWDDGRAECWGNFNAFLGATSVSGGIQTDLPSVPLPITFTDKASTQIVATCSSMDSGHPHYGWLMYTNYTTTNTGTGARFGSFDGEIGVIHLYVTGFWK